MNKKDQEAINELKKYINSNKKEEKNNNQSNDVFNHLFLLLNKLYENAKEDRKTYIKNITNDVLSKIPKPKEPKQLNEVFEIDEIVEKVLTEVKISEIDLKNIIKELKKDKKFLNQIKGEKGEQGIPGFGGYGGGGLGVRDVRKEIDERAQIATYTNTNSNLSATIIKDAIDEIDSTVSNLVTSGFVEYQGTWNASTNSPSLSSSIGIKGYYYVVSTSGTTDINGISDWNVTDWIIYNGTVWEKVDNTDEVLSVFGKTGTIEQLNSASFDPNYTSASYPVHQEGLLFYDFENKTLAHYNDKTDVTLQIGQETHVRVVNKTSDTILNGTVVEITGAQGNRPTIDNVSATSANDCYTIGIVTHNIPINEEGLVTINGTVGGLNTSEFSEGTVVYLSTSGTLTSATQNAPIPTIEIGHVLTSHSNQGKILVTIKKSESFLGLSDVNGSTPVQGSLMVYDAVKNYWDVNGNTSAFTQTSAISNVGNVVYVSEQGNDTAIADGTSIKPYRTITYALSKITDNSSTNRYAVYVMPGGTYNENNPLIMKDYVNVVSLGFSEATNISATNDDYLVSGADESELIGFTLRSYPSSDYACIVMNNSGRFHTTHNHIKNSKYGILVDNINADLDLHDVIFQGDATDCIKVTNGSLHGRSIKLEGNPTVTNFVNISGSNSKVDLFGIDVDNNNLECAIVIQSSADANITSFSITSATEALRVESGGHLHANGALINYCTSAIILQDDITHVGIFGCQVGHSTDYDLVIGANSEFRSQGSHFREDKMLIDPDADILINNISTTPGDTGIEVKGELHVGSPQFPNESVFGEGDSYTRGMLLYTYEAGTSAWNDVTTSAQSYTGSIFGFPSNSADSAMYASSDLQRDGDYLKHYGVKMQITTSADFGSGGMVAEYWNGTSWTTFTFMVTEGNSPYLPIGQTLSGVSGSYQLRYNSNIVDDWVKNDPMGTGTNRYWARYRITSPVNQPMEWEQIKLHSNRFEINADGWIEYFGSSRPLNTLPWHFGLLGRNTALGNQTLFLGDNLSVAFQYNLWNTNGDVVGFNSVVPLDMDTSTPIKLRWAVRPASDGNVEWTVRWSWSNDGDTIYPSTVTAPTSAVNEQVITTSGSTSVGIQKWFGVDLDISNLRTRKTNGFPDVLWVSIERTTSDGDLAGFAIDPEYLKWCEGGHV